MYNPELIKAIKDEINCLEHSLTFLTDPIEKKEIEFSINEFKIFLRKIE